MTSRQLTRDLLLEYDIPTLCPHFGGLNMVYPWENTNIGTLSHQLYLIAKKNGFSGTEQNFNKSFGTFAGTRPIIYANFINFPTIGEDEKLYFDLEEKILYYWDGEYIPVNANLIANSIIDGGEA